MAGSFFDSSVFLKKMKFGFGYIKFSLFIGLVFSALSWQKFIDIPSSLKVSLLVETSAPDNEVGAIFCDDGKGYRGVNRNDLEYSDSNRVGENLYKFKVKLPCGDATKSIRFDPVWGDGEVKLKEFAIRTYRWFDIDVSNRGAKEIGAINSIAMIEYLEDGVLIKSAGIDPIVELLSGVTEYYEVRKFDAIILVLLIGAVFALLIKTFQLALSFLLKNGPSIEQFRERIGLQLDRAIGVASSTLLSRVREEKEVNTLAYTAALLLSFLAALNFTSSIYLFPSISFFSCLLATLILYLLVVLLLAALDLSFFREGKSWVLPVFAILAPVVFFFDTVLFSLNGMHLGHGLTLLLDGGLKNFQRNLEFTKLSKELLYLYELGVVGLIFLSIAFSVYGKYKFARFSVKLSVINVFWSVALLVVVLLSEQYFSRYIKQPKQWVQEQTDLPIYIPFFEASDYIFSLPASVDVSVAPSATLQHDLDHGLGKPFPNVYIFIMESVREDMISPETSPNIFSFKMGNLAFEKGVANGNATHYGWYSIINSRLPISWEYVKNNKVLHGSEALRILKTFGFEVNIFTSKDLAYLDSLAILFNNGELYDYISPRFSGSVPAGDYQANEQLINNIEVSANSTPELNIIMWDSTHYPYRWPSGFPGEFVPYAGTPDSGINLNKAKELAIAQPDLILNRYRSSIKYLDSLFGKFISELKENSLYEDSIIVVVGDHGQQFMEHNYLMHGRTMYKEDLHIPLYFKLTGEASLDPKGLVASQVDIMPTVLANLGIKIPVENYSDGDDLSNPSPSSKFVVSAAAGFKNTPYKFQLESINQKVLFEIDRLDPAHSKRVVVTDVLTNQDVSKFSAGGSSDAIGKQIYDDFLEKLTYISFISKP